ncbi:MAG TPA: glycosyltransferase family 39 protein [Spirillospora sp.]|nr:glycosyltransferase family 39 protein [Spirillospora sp.]
MPLHYIEILTLIPILLLAAALRFGWPGVNSFAFDEARVSLIALDMARGGHFATVGMPSSVGIPNFPAATWIYSLPYFISPDPLVATQFTALLSVGAVLATWALARRVWGAGAGLAAALFLVASPYAVLYSRSIWAQNLLPVIGIAWAWTAYLGASKRSRWAIGLHMFLAGFAFQVHFAGGALILPSAYFFVRFRWWRQIIPVLAGGGMALLALLPFVWEVACCRPDIMAQFGSALGGESQVDLTSYAQVIQLALGLDWGYLLLGNLQPPDVPLLALIAGALVGVGFIVIVTRLVRARHAVPLQESTDSVHLAEIVLAWLLLPPLFFLRHSSPVLIHYFLAALPALALVVGVGVSLIKPDAREGLRSSPTPSDITGETGRAQHAVPLRKLIGIGLFITLIGLALVWAAQVAQALTLAGQVETPNGLGTPLEYTRAAAYGLPDDAPVLFFTHGDDPNVDGEAAVFEALWWGREHRIVQGGSLLILPDAPAYLMATLRPIQAWEEIDDAGLALDVQRFPRREGAEPFIATFYDGTAEPAGFTLLDEPLRLADGTQLEGWKARRVGPRLRISTLWRVLELPAQGTYQQFHHLRAADTLDQPLAISDVTISAHRWQAGDRLIVMGDFFVDEAGPFWVDVGHYTLPDGQRIPTVDGSDGLIRLGSFEIATDG